MAVCKVAVAAISEYCTHQSKHVKHGSHVWSVSGVITEVEAGLSREELVSLLEEVVEIFGPIRRGAMEGETGHRAETELAKLRETLDNCDN